MALLVRLHRMLHMLRQAGTSARRAGLLTHPASMTQTAGRRKGNDEAPPPKGDRALAPQNLYVQARHTCSPRHASSRRAASAVNR